MTAVFWTCFLFVTAFVVLACVAALGVATGWLSVAARRPARKTTPPKEPGNG